MSMLLNEEQRLLQRERAGIPLRAGASQCAAPTARHARAA